MANQGIYHPTYNPNGSKKLSDGNFWYNTTIPINSTMDCFDSSKMLTASGYIGTVSGRPDGLFYDEINQADIIDLRNSSKKVEDYNRLISREFNKLVGGTYRSKEAEWTTTTTFGTTNFLYDNGGVNVTIYDPNFLGASELSIGDTINVAYYNGSTFIYDRATVTISSNQALMVNAPNIAAAISGGVLKDGIKFCIYSKRTTRTKSNTLLHCDIIGNPINYPTAWKQSGVFGTPLIVAEDGSSLLPDGIKDSFKLSRKANATPLLCLRSTDKGISWTSFTPTFSTTTNTITLTDEPAGNIVLVYYQTKTSMATPTVNSEVLEIGEVLGTNGLANAHLVSTLIGKVPTANTAPYLQMGYDINSYRIDASTLKFSTTAAEIPLHSALSLVGGASGVPAVKVLPYLTRLNGKAYLNLVFKEMKHNGTSWGDSSKFEIGDNVSTTTDNNAQTVLIGQKTVELGYFIANGE